jgi:hypothetical protein
MSAAQLLERIQMQLAAMFILGQGQGQGRGHGGHFTAQMRVASLRDGSRRHRAAAVLDLLPIARKAKYNK